MLMTVACDKNYPGPRRGFQPHVCGRERQIPERVYIEPCRAYCVEHRERRMHLKGIIRSAINMLKLAKKSDRDEFLLYLKLVMLGLLAVGAIGFVVQFVGSLLKLGG